MSSVQDYQDAKIADVAEKDWWPLQEWPNTYKDLLIKPAKNNRDRFALYTFLAGNGMEPREAKNVVMDRKQHDADAERQMNWLVKHNMKVLQKYSTYDMNLRKIL